jgi:hypothetical protein
VLELRQLDLQLAFVRTRALREDVEDQAGAVDDAALGQLFQIAFLHRTQRAVDQDQIGVEREALRLQLFGLAGADVVARIRPFDARGQRADDAGAGRACQLAELGERSGVLATGLLRLQQQRALAFFRTFEQRNYS